MHECPNKHDTKTIFALLMHKKFEDKKGLTLTSKDSSMIVVPKKIQRRLGQKTVPNKTKKDHYLSSQTHRQNKHKYHTIVSNMQKF